MTNLTEYSWYYCKMKNGDIRILERGSDYFLDGDVPLLNNEVESVLAPVPSYEELQNQAFILKSRESEITKLKKLLKECRKHFINYKRDDLDKGYVVYDGSYLIDKINQVLGEE